MMNVKLAAPTPTWLVNHRLAMSAPRPGHEAAIVGMLNAWLAYEAVHLKAFESKLGEDYVLGPAWESMGKAIRDLLNGTTGRLDCGTIDGVICDHLRAQGFAV
jgi:hypothetical protein